MEHVKRNILACFAVLCGLADASGQLTNHLALEGLRQLRRSDVVLESATPMAPASSGSIHAAAVKVDGVIGGNIRFDLQTRGAGRESPI